MGPATHTPHISGAEQRGRTIDMDFTNEVLANLAEEKLGGRRGTYKRVHPNDHAGATEKAARLIGSRGRQGASAQPAGAHPAASRAPSVK